MRQVVDPGSGAVTFNVDFDAFGNSVGTTGTPRSAYQWQAQSGYRNDSDIGISIISHTYDTAGKKGLLSTTTDGSGRLLTYTYTARNEQASVADSSGTTSFQYDENGSKTRTFYPNGLFAALWYDNAGREYAHYNLKPLTGSTWTELSSYGYTFDDDGRVLTFNEGTDANLPPQDVNQTAKTTFVYDGQGRLTSETWTG